MLTSDSEGLPIAALEALAAGMPVVSTPVAGMRELLGSGAGTVVADFTPTAVASATLAALRDPQARARQGAAGRRLVEERHSMAAMVERYVDCYRA